MINTKQPILYLLLLLIGFVFSSNSFAAYECEKMKVIINNESNFITWKLDKTKTTGDDNAPPAELKPGSSADFTVNSTTYWSNIEDGEYSFEDEIGDLTGSKYKQDIYYTLFSDANPNGEQYEVGLELEYGICWAPYYCQDDPTTFEHEGGKIDADAAIIEDPANLVTHNSIRDGNSGDYSLDINCAIWCEDNITGLDYICDYEDMQNGKAEFTIRAPTAFALKIELTHQEDFSGTTIKDKTFLQQVYNNLKPSILKEFDTIFGHPTQYDEDGQFDFNFPCTTHVCTCYINPSASIC